MSPSPQSDLLLRLFHFPFCDGGALHVLPRWQPELLSCRSPDARHVLPASRANIARKDELGIPVHFFSQIADQAEDTITTLQRFLRHGPQDPHTADGAGYR